MAGIKEMTKRQRAIAEEETPIFSESIERAETRIEELKLLIKEWKDDRESKE